MEELAFFDTPLGCIGITCEQGAVTRLRFAAEAEASAPHVPSALCSQAARELAAYLRGERQAFSVPLRAAGTPFEQAVWAAVAAIPYGETRSYGQLAAALGRPRAARAVGAANAKNPLAIFVPCHRVVGANGTLTGYAWGLWRKEALLALESRAAKHGG